MATLSLSYDNTAQLLYWTISGLGADFTSDNYICAGIADSLAVNGGSKPPANIHSTVYASSWGTNSVSGSCSVSGWSVGYYTLTGFTQIASNGTYYTAGTATFYLSEPALPSGSLTIELKDGIEYITGAYFTANSNRHPETGSDIFYPDDTSEAFTCNRFWIDQVAFKNGYTFPWNAEYGGYYTTAERHPSNGYTSEVNVVIYPSNNLWAKFSISATKEATYTIYVYYSANGGSGAPSYADDFYNISTTGSCTVKCGPLSTTIPIRSGYTFLGWSKDPNATAASYSSGGTFYETVTATETTIWLYAVWKKNEFKSSVSADGFNCCFASVEVSDEAPSYGDSVTFNATLNDGYTFRGWYNSSGILVSSSNSYSTTVTEDISLYARANVKWTYAKSKGSSIITAEEWNRLQTYITQRNNSAFASVAVVGQSLRATLFNAVASAINYNKTAIKGEHIYASYLNNLITYANKL